MPFIAFFFAISGFCSLVYQVAWLRVSMADFGVTSTLTAIVLSVFMAGLALGSWWGGRLVSGAFRFRTPGGMLRLYGMAEAIIGCSGIVAAPLLHFGRIRLLSAGMEWGSGGYYLASGGVVLVALLPFCVCMGATFPLAMAAVRGAFPARSATSFSRLYLANLSGAVAGCCLTAFVLIELLGFLRTMAVASCLNAAVAAGAFILSRRLPGPPEAGTGCAPCSEDAAIAPAADRRLYLLLVVTGMTSMALEVIWIRQLTPFLGPVVYTFAAILSLFLLANFAGSRIYRAAREQSFLPPGNTLPALLAATAGVASLLALVAADYRLPFSDGLAGGLCRAAVAVVPFGLVLGFVTPCVIDRLSGGDPNRAGTAYALNAAGCIPGPLVAGFVLLPQMGEKWSVLLLSALLIMLAPLLLKGVKRDAGTPFSLPVRYGFPALAAVIALLLAGATKDYETRYPGSVVLRDHTATVTAAGRGMERLLLVNGFGMTELSPVTKMMVHLPMAMRAAPAKNGLVLCFGMGTSFRSMLTWGVPVTAVELVPSIPRLFGYYHADADRIAADSRARIVIDDARRYLSRTTDVFDVIVADPPPPIEAAASSLLYSVEFYRDVAARLSPGGLFQQWTDSDDPSILSSITRSLTTVFPFVRAFNSMKGWGMHYVASMRPFPARNADGAAAVTPPRAAADLVEWGPYATATEHYGAVLSRERDLAELIQAAPAARAITDDRPVNEYCLLRQTVGLK